MPNPIFAPVAMGASADRRGTEPRFEPRPHFEAAIGDADGVQPAHGTTATQFQNANMAQRPQFGQFVGEMQHPVDHGVLGEEPALPLGIGQENDDASRQIRKHLEFVEELLELSVRRGGLLCGHQTIDDGQPGRLLRHDATNERQQAGQSLGFERAEPTDVVDGFGNLRFVEKCHPAQMPEHPRMRFREQGDVDRSAALGCVVEAGLVRQNGFAGTRGPLHDVDPSLEQAAIKNEVETRNTGPMPIGRRGLIAHSLSSRRWSLSGRRGSDTANVEPTPTALSTLIEPPMAAHTLRTTQRPMPNPPLRLVSGPRSNRSKMTSCLCGGMPTP